jgi:hypothetical protein
MADSTYHLWCWVHEEGYTDLLNSVLGRIEHGSFILIQEKSLKCSLQAQRIFTPSALT